MWVLENVKKLFSERLDKVIEIIGIPAWHMRRLGFSALM